MRENPSTEQEYEENLSCISFSAGAFIQITVSAYTISEHDTELPDLVLDVDGSEPEKTQLMLEITGLVFSWRSNISSLPTT